MELALILICGTIAIATAVMVILSRNTVHSALWMIGNCFILAVLFLLLHFQFIAIMQVIVYAGAIMMFVLYAIMMLNLRLSDDSADIVKNILNGRYLLLALFFIGILIIGVGFGPMALKGSMTDQAMTKLGEVELLANYIFAEGLLPFELVSVLLTAAIVGAIYLAKKD
ncbi:MAG: NADH-quinone oxidoreductase subunit J [Anaerolineales bacterium]|nr:NADH-quinone oxidoreductase subunit J [Anaerolineales bacterium]